MYRISEFQISLLLSTGKLWMLKTIFFSGKMNESNGDCHVNLLFKDVPIESFESFSSKSKKLTPVVIRGFDIGPCSTHWTPDFLKTKLRNKVVTVHKSKSPILQFLPKNFSYHNMSFDEFIGAMNDNDSSFYYLRSLADSPRDKVANIQHDFPEICDDISFPPLNDNDTFFSSVFRISSPGVELWTHFDTMDNFLIQIKGEKRVVFFPPSDALNLYLIEDKSRVCDLDNIDLQSFPKLTRCNAWKCILQPGDVVFIPAFWFHNVKAIDFR